MAPIIGKAKAAVDISIAYLTGIRHLFHRPYTLRFPQQRYAVEKGYRGRHLLHLDRCTGCGICAWICPKNASRSYSAETAGFQNTSTGAAVFVIFAQIIARSLRWKKRSSMILRSILGIGLYGRPRGWLS